MGDALGVPVEFKPREALRREPVRGISGYGTHYQPPGTWSDDSSMALLTAESLLGGYDPDDIMLRFRQWIARGAMTPYGVVFDAGITTRAAIRRAEEGIRPELCGGGAEGDNGNGSLMRILPLSVAVRGLGTDEIIRRSFEVSALTHAHLRSRLCCAYFSLLVRGVLEGMGLKTAMGRATRELTPQIPPEEHAILRDILDGGVLERPEERIESGGYVIHTLEAALWCCHKYLDYPSAVLAAVNLGNDTDTTAAVAGGLAGLLYGQQAIPLEWIQALARREDVLRLANAFACLVLAESGRA